MKLSAVTVFLCLLVAANTQAQLMVIETTDFNGGLVNSASDEFVGDLMAGTNTIAGNLSGFCTEHNGSLFCRPDQPVPNLPPGDAADGFTFGLPDGLQIDAATILFVKDPESIGDTPYYFVSQDVDGASGFDVEFITNPIIAGVYDEFDLVTDTLTDSLYSFLVAVSFSFGFMEGAFSTDWVLLITVSPIADTDSDGVHDLADNCLQVANFSQRDTDADGIGNVCDPDVATPNDCAVNFHDLNVYKDNFFQQGDLDTDNNDDGTTNFSDLDILRDFFFSTPGPSATGCRIVDGTGQLIGARDVLVGGLLYDVEFQTGTCAEVYGDCQTSNLTFQQEAESRVASEALLDQVFRDISAGQFNSQPDLTRGCGGPDFCVLITPHFVDESGVGSGAVENRATPGADDVYGFSFPHTFTPFTTQDSFAWVRWTIQSGQESRQTGSD